MKTVLLRYGTETVLGGEYRRHADSGVAQFLTFVSLSADMYSSFGGSTVQLDAKYLTMSDHRRVPAKTDGGNCTYQLH